MHDGRIRVLVVDDQRLVAEAFAEHLAQEDDVDLVGVASDDAGAMAAIEEHLPHVVLLDYMLPRAEGPEVAAAIRDRWPGVRVVMVTGRTDDLARRRSLDAGCVGFVGKDASTDELLRAVRSAAGQADVPGASPSAATGAGPTGSSAQPESAPITTVTEGRGGPTVTPRELEVLRMLAAGRTTREIASALFISYATTRNHIQHILHKLGAHSRLQAVAIATRTGLIGREVPGSDPTRPVVDDGPSPGTVGAGP